MTSRPTIFARASTAIHRSRRIGRDLVATMRSRIASGIDYLLYERRLGLDTRGTVVLSGHDHRNLPYQPARWRTLRESLRADELCPDDVFLDAGCGKGRIVIEAARYYPFKRVTGFDISADMVSIAQANVAKCRRRLRAQKVEIIAADAGTWQTPEDVTVVFLYNPFVGEVLERFIASVLESHDRRPRRVRLLYVEGLGSDFGAVEGTGRFSLIRTVERRVKAPQTRLYEVVPAPSPRHG